MPGKCNVKVKCKADHVHQFIYKEFNDYNEALNFIKMQELDAHFYRRSVHQKNIYFEVGCAAYPIQLPLSLQSNKNIYLET